MNYQQTLAKIHSLNRFGTRLGLERMSALLHRLGDPQRSLRFIHVAGTNGKGSVSAMLSEIFIAEGMRVGLYTSPYIIDFRERMQFCGEMISKEDLCMYAQEVFAQAERMDDMPTEFEVVTAIAMLYFAAKECDIVVLEVGLGGIYDATNVIDTPLASVITSISYDHTDYLGETLASIAANKAGIIKSGGTTILAYGQAPEVEEVIREAAGKQQNRLLICENKTRSYNGKAFFYGDKMYELSMLGFHQMQNAVTAIETAKLLGACDTSIFKGIRAARLPARMELAHRHPDIIIDGAHNLDGVEQLCKTMRHFFAEKRIIAVTAMMEDKQWKDCVLKIEDIAAKMVATTASNPRALSAEALGNYLHCPFFESARDALDYAETLSDEQTLILVCGSLYLAADIRGYILCEE